MANYTNTTNIGTFLQRSLTANESAALTAYILNAVDKWIDRLLNTTFQNVSETTRYFDGGSRSVDIDPVQAVSAVKTVNNDDTNSNTYTNLYDYVLEPVNDTVKRELRKRGRGRWPTGARRVAVTGKFSEYDYDSGAVPADIVMAATQLAAGIINAGKQTSNGGNVASEELEGHKITYNTSANTFEVMTANNPLLQGMLAERRELYLYSEDDDTYEDYDD